MKTTLATAAVAMGLLALSSTIHADQVFWTKPTNNSDAYAGCSLELGFRVQYSDLAILAYVQLQVLDSENKVLVENIDNSTREEWDSVRAKNVTWSVPQDWPAGDYILRAFGDAYYSCTENGVRTYCPLPLEDRETIHVKHLTEGQSCPAIATPSPASEPSPSPPAPSSATNSTNSKDLSQKDTSIKEEASPQKSGIHIDVETSILDLLKKNGINLDQMTNSTNGKAVDSSKIAEAKQKELSQDGSSSTKQHFSSSGAGMARGGVSMWGSMDNGATLSALVAIVFFSFPTLG
ncbi:hypothetical protein BGX27_005773 [Mortierella sp. AM989]|nr:hypothetical protein BGX27_005773 [Mortierella sp. AM989]